MINVKRLSDVAQINPKGPNSGELSSDELCDFVPMSAVSEDGTMVVSDHRSYSQVSKGYTPFRQGDVLLAKITPCFENGKIALATTKTNYAFGSTEFHVVRSQSNILHPRYLLHFLRQPQVRVDGENRMTGSGGQKRVPRSFLDELVISVPPLNDQRRIAAILDTANAIRVKREQALALADDFLKSVFLEMFGAPNHPDPKLDALALGNVCDLFAGSSLPAGKEYSGQDGGYLLLKVGDLNLPGNEQVVTTAREWIAEKAANRGAIVAPKGAVVFPKRGGAIATNKKRVLGRACILDPNLMAVAPKKDAPASASYLRVWFELLDLVSVSNGSTIPQLNKGDLYPLEMSVPLTGQGERFDQLFDHLNKLRSNIYLDLASADALFAALSQRAFCGEL